jgi:predicted TIM-barrel fold metal-dependent hydrolase
MKTPWGEIPICDAHVHFFSHRFFNALADQKPGLRGEDIPGLLGWEAPDPDPVKLAERWIKELDAHNVSRAALIGSIPGDEKSVLPAVKLFPDRLYGYSMLNPCAPEAEEQTIAALAGGLRGVCLFPAMHRYAIQDDRALRIIDLVAKNDATAKDAGSKKPSTIVFVHCGVLSVGVRKKLGLPSLFDMRYSNPIDLHAVALQYPRISFVIPHFGAGYFREALMVCDLCPNVYLDTSSSNSWIKYQAETIGLRDVFKRALEVAGARRLLFGTDSSFFPRGWNKAVFQAQVEILSGLGVSDEDATLIFGGNLERLLGTP